MDLRGRRGVILAGGALHTLVCGLYLTVSGIGPWIYTLRVLHGFAEALLFTSLFTMAADLVPAGRRTEGLALFGASGMLPVALGGLLGDGILALADYPALFGAALGFAAVSLALSLPLFDAPRTPGAVHPSRGFRAALLQRDLLPLWWMGSVFALALASAFAFIRRFVDETGIGSVGGFFAAYSGAALTMRIFLGWLPDRVGPKRMLYPALATLAAGFAALSVAHGARDVVLAGILCGIGHGYAFPILFGLVLGRASDADRGSATAIFTALFDVGMLLGAPVFGALSRGLGFAVMYGAAAGAIVAGCLVFWLWDRRR
jgi:MFS family permease